MNTLINFSQNLFLLFNEMAIYLLLGFAFAGLLRVIFSNKLIIKYLGEKSFKSSFLASIFGVPLPLCSCGVVPTGISLYKQGASKGSTISFLTSTPQTGIDSVLVTYAFLGLPFALFKLLSAFVTGVVGGLFYNAISDNTDTKRMENMKAVPRLKTFKGFLEYSFIELIDTLRKWLMIGILLAAALSTFIPNDFIQNLGINNLFLLYVIILAIAVPMYICATASVPVAAALLMKGFPLGAIIIFLMAGPATNMATLTVLWKSLGKKATLVYLINILIGSLAFAFIFDIFIAGHITMPAKMGHHHEAMALLNYLGSAVLGILLIYSYGKDYLPKRFNKANSIVSNLKFKIIGIRCGGCVSKVKTKLSVVEEITEIELNTDGDCEIKYINNNPMKQIESILSELDYKIIDRVE